MFTVVIPTKNRPDRVVDALRSVLEQTYADLEVIVCDNSDDDMSAATAAVVTKATDDRVRYLRTNGKLSMPDNWEHAVAHARGDFVGVLTDRSAYRSNALETAAREIETTGTAGVAWLADRYDYDGNGSFRRQARTGRAHRLESRAVLEYFVDGHPKFAVKLLPKLMTAVFSRRVLDKIRSSPVGRCCPVVAPDFTSGFLFLAHTDWFVFLDRALYVSCGTGNGQSFRRRGELGERFRRDLGMSYEDMVDRMPSGASFSHALVLNDLMRLRDQMPDRFAGLEVNRAQYYLGCLNDYVKTKRQGILRDDDLTVLLDALEREPRTLRRRVKETKLYLLATRPVEAPPGGRVKPGSTPQSFATVFDAMAWDEAHQLEPVPEGFADTLPGVDTIGPAKPRQPRRPGRAQLHRHVRRSTKAIRRSGRRPVRFALRAVRARSLKRRLRTTSRWAVALRSSRRVSRR